MFPMYRAMYTYTLQANGGVKQWNGLYVLLLLYLYLYLYIMYKKIQSYLSRLEWVEVVEGRRRRDL